MRQPVAYDYDKQEWTSGERAERLIREQARKTLAVIDDPRYRRMMGYSDGDAVKIKVTAQNVLEG